ncbi:MAG: DoxX family protein [Thermosynechococcaceae cyanobacterium]
MAKTAPMTAPEAAPSLLSILFSSTQESTIVFQIGWTILRAIAGAMMIHNGVGKLSDVEGFASYVVSQTMGLPFPTFLTYCAAYTEIIASALLIVGLLTRPAAISLLFTMLMAVYFHICEDGFVIASFETAALYGGMYLFCAVNGGGLFSVDSLIAKQVIGSKT